MKKAKKADEKNSLEQLLLRWKDSYNANKSKTYQFVLVFAIVVLVVMFFRVNLFSRSDKMSQVDNAYYVATSPAFAGAGAVNTAPLVQVADSYRGKSISFVLYAEAGEAFLLNGFADVAAKKAHSRGVKGEAELADPLINFNSAYESFTNAEKSEDTIIKARAFYGSGVAQEALASISAKSEDVDMALQKAREAYEQVLTFDSPYRALASDRMVALESGVTLDFYKSVAQNFVTLPEPSETESILSGNDALNPNDPINVEGFSTETDTSSQPSAETDVVEKDSANSEIPKE